MKNVLKIAIVPCCLAGLYQADVSAAEKMNGSSFHQHKLSMRESLKDKVAVNTLEDTHKLIIKQQNEISNRVRNEQQQDNWLAYTSNFAKTPKAKGEGELKTNLSTKPANPSTDISGWYTDNNRITVKYAQAKQIGKYGNGGLYVYMDPSFTGSQWKEAFDKGFAEHAKGANGIKVLNSVIELKINADARLYTTKLHKNDRGDYIAILDNEGRHKEIHRKANKSRLEVKECASAPHQK